MSDYTIFVNLLTKAHAEYEEFIWCGQPCIRVYNDDGDNVDFTFSQKEKELYMVN